MRYFELSRHAFTILKSSLENSSSLKPGVFVPALINKNS